MSARADAYLGGGGVDIPVAIRPVPYAVEDAPNSKVPNAGPAAPMDFRMWYKQTKQLVPTRRRLARSKIIGAAAPAKVSSPYNLLRTQILKRLQENGWSTIAVTSPTRASGTTLTAINLAISIARDSNYSVMLVEMNLVAPSVCQTLGLKARQGISDHLLHDVPISEIMFNPGIDRLVIIPAGSPVRNSSELLSSAKMIRFVEELKDRYQPRIIVFDLPSALSNDDAMVFAPLVDCALLVVEEGETRVSDVRRAADYLASTNILGVVINRSLHVEEDGKIIYR